MSQHRYASALSVLVRVSAIIFVVEAIIMLLLSLLPLSVNAWLNRSEWLLAAADSIALTMIASPLVWYLVILPFVRGQRAAEDGLRASEETHRALIENLSDLIIILDKDGVNLWNSPAVRRFGMEPEDAIGINARDFAHPDDLPNLDQTLAYVVQHPGEIVKLDGLKAITPDGEVHYLNDTLVYLPDTPGIRGIVVVVHDDTDRKRAEDELVEAKKKAEFSDQAKTDFLANMSHELRTPLNAINGYAQLVELEPYGPLGDARYLEYVKYIQESGDHLLGIIDDILDLTRIEAGKMRIEDDTVELGDILRSSIGFLNSRIIEKELALTFPPPESWPKLRADPRMVRQMLLNLLSNAMKFSKPEARIDITGQSDDDGGLTIIVADSGIGMSDDEVAIALERFGQVESPLVRSNEGTGLGLPLVRSQIELHGGHLTIDSEKGVGTRVRLYFPSQRVMKA